MSTLYEQILKRKNSGKYRKHFLNLENKLHTSQKLPRGGYQKVRFDFGIFAQI